jgi:predicted RNA-binding Zn ribbon-like protein
MSEIPAEIALVQDFVNTRDVEDGTDAIADPGALRAWLRARGLPAPERVSEAEVAMTLELRESLRELLLGHHEERVPEDALASVNRLAQRLPLYVAFNDDAVPTVAAGAAGVPGALAEVLGHVLVAASRGTWARLKACSKQSCRWAFYDHSRNRSGRWCSMRVCGNRTKTRAYRARQRGER